MINHCFQKFPDKNKSGKPLYSLYTLVHNINNSDVQNKIKYLVDFLGFFLQHITIAYVEMLLNQQSVNTFPGY